MADRLNEIMELVRSICEEQNLRVTLRGAVRNGVAAGIGGCVGCIIGGPFGGIPGAAIGAAVGAITGDDFKPLWKVIAEWPTEEKRKLAANIENIIKRVDARDVATFTAMAAAAAPALKAEVAGAVIDFCKNEMHMQVA
ncbi:unnamed protein product [Larinioides sclopetarius]|uniref:Uncharacterized protein n=1 Tax=Larinioides sclopetarius TaxID=280406 RepID=A0AAV2A140_9ARAC